MNQKQYFIEKIDTLPDDLQYAIMFSDWEKSLAEIQKEYKLHLDQGQVLETTATQLMFGDIEASEFINIMFTEGHISSQVAADILLDIDNKILKKIRESIEDFAQAREREKKLQDLLRTDEEKIADEEAESYAEYYRDQALAIEKTRDNLINMGLQPDGSDATDEQMAQALDMTLEEYRQEQQQISSSDTPVIPEDISKEKEDLLKELETPQKSFVKPLFTQPVEITTPAPTYKLDHEPLAPDHQIENVSIEKPYHEPEPVILKTEDVVAPVETPSITAPEAPITPLIKKPIKINMSHDIYREPIE